MFKSKLFYILILFCCLFLLSCEDKNPTESIETAQLTGYVYQALNGFSKRIPNADISIGNNSTKSDSLGLYSLEVPLGEHEILISHELFSSTTDTIKIRGDRSYLVNLLNGPAYSVSGVLTDTLGAVVEGAVVELAHLRDTTDINGRYKFSVILAGSRILSCDYLDYYLFVDTLEITDTDISENINLIRQGYNISGTVSHPVDGLLSGIEVVLDDSLYDTTDFNGEYYFDNIFIGEHQLKISSTIYDNQIIDFSLAKAELVQSFELVKTIVFVQTVDTLWIEKDVMVQYTQTMTYSCCADENYGNSEQHWLMYDYIYDNSPISGFYFHSYNANIYFIIPSIDTNTVDSIFLVLSQTESSYYNPTFSFYKVNSIWYDSSITWNNQPEVSNQQTTVPIELIIEKKWKFNLTEYLDVFITEYGFKIIPIGNPSFISLHSSESPELDKRPYILLYRTE